jgi:hypothetical protein
VPAVCLQSICNITSIGSLVQENFDDHFLIIFYPKPTLDGFSDTKWENNYDINRILETDLIYLTLRRIHTPEISFREMRTPELNAGGWCMYLSTRRCNARWTIIIVQLVSILNQIQKINSKDVEARKYDLQRI